jgi:hypothetical protein
MRRKVLVSIGLGTFLACSLAFFLPWKKEDSKDLADTLRKDCPVMAQMSEVSKMIEQGDLTAALDESLRIEEGLASQETSTLVQPGAITRILNIKRIAELYHALGLFQEEAEAWQRLEDRWMSASVTDREALSHVENSLKEENLDLGSFISSRKREALSKL